MFVCFCVDVCVCVVHLRMCEYVGVGAYIHTYVRVGMLVCSTVT